MDSFYAVCDASQRALSTNMAQVLGNADASVEALKVALSNKKTRDAALLSLGIGFGVFITIGGVVYVGKHIFSKPVANSREQSLAGAATKPVLDLTKFEKQVIGDLVDQENLSQDFDDIGGLDDQIRQIEELVIYPLSHPHLYQHSAVAQQPTGLLLYGPPGTGKTLLAKAIAKTARASFINVNVAHIQSKWFGETPKLVEAIFSLARKVSPCVVFVDEIDGVLSARNDMDMQHVNTMKTKFMECWDGLTTPAASHSSYDEDEKDANVAVQGAASKEPKSDWVLVIGATNKPWALDPAVLRRMPRQLYVGLPDARGRAAILAVLLRRERAVLNLDLTNIARATEGYSGSDLKELVRAAALVPIREVVAAERAAVRAAKGKIGGPTMPPPSSHARPLDESDLIAALDMVKPTGVAASQYRNQQASAVNGFSVEGPSRGSGQSARPGSTESRGVDMSTAPSYAPTASLRLNTMQLSSAIEGATQAIPPAIAASSGAHALKARPQGSNTIPIASLSQPGKDLHASALHASALGSSRVGYSKAAEQQPPRSTVKRFNGQASHGLGSSSVRTGTSSGL